MSAEGNPTDAAPVCFLFKSGRAERLSAAGRFPTDFFYGYAELSRRGAEVCLLDEIEIARLAKGPGEIVARWLDRVIRRLVPRLPFSLDSLWRLAAPRVRRRLAESRVLVATTQTFGLCLGLLKRLGLIKARIVFIVMGAIPLDLPPRLQRFVAWLLADCEIAALSRNEIAYLRRHLPASTAIDYLPFGVDTGFWYPAAAQPCETAIANDGPFVLSIGNDLNRDFTTLVQAWQPHFPRLLIVTRLPVRVPPDMVNVTVVSGDWRRQLLSDDEIRRLFRACVAVVIPLRETIQPAGQSACLQAMACGKAVVLSAIRGLWDEACLRDGETCLLVPPGDPDAIARAILALEAEPPLRQRIGAAARAAVESGFTTEIMANHMQRFISGGEHV